MRSTSLAILLLAATLTPHARADDPLARQLLRVSELAQGEHALTLALVQVRPGLAGFQRC